MRRVSVQVISLVAAAMLGAAAAPGVASAQSHADLVWRQLNTAFENSSGDGYSSLNYILGRMGEDEVESWTISLTAGKTYRIVGFCDADCRDVDIEVLDGSTSVARDVLTDDYPIVNFVAGKAARYTIRVIMAACSSEPCYYGIGIFQK
ncbi:MAG: hypothetical protein WD771_10835 [Gemmatimonadaceae bacterium]